MALTPTALTDEQFIDTFKSVVSDSVELAVSKTYKFDFNTGRFLGLIDERDALLQYIVKTLLTQRDYYSIYTQDYGSELWELIGADVTQSYLDSEVPRMVREALLIDDRVVSVNNVSIEIKGDSAYISLAVKSVYGEIETVVKL